MDNDIKYDFYKFDIKKFVKDWLSTNPNAIPILEKFPEMVYERGILKNPNALEIIKKMLPKMSKTSLKSNFATIGRNTNPDIIPIIEEYLEKYPCIATKTFWTYLSSNPIAIPLLQKNLKNIDWKSLSSNPNGLQILKEHPIKINWKFLSANPHVVPYLEENLDKVNWAELSTNKNAVHLLEKFPKKINWYRIGSNPNAIHIMENNFALLDLWVLCENENAIPLIEKNMDKILAHHFHKSQLLSPHFRKMMCQNKNAIDYLKKYIHQFDDDCWFFLSRNPNAIPILLKNVDKINFHSFSSNENIMQLFLSDNGIVPETVTRLKIPRKSERKKKGT